MMFESVELISQAQTAHWTLTIGLFLWFVGLAGMGLFLNLWLRSKTVFVITALSMWGGTLLVMSHLGRLLNLPVAIFNALTHLSFNLTSWMLIGITILSIAGVWLLLQMVNLLKGKNPVECDLFVKSNAVIGVVATVYSGFLLTQAVGITFWNTGIIPVLWLCSGLSCALGLVEVLVAMNKIEHDRLGWIANAGHPVHIAEAVVIFALIVTSLNGVPGAAVGAQSLLSGPNAMLFWVGAIGVGLVLPTLLSFFKGKGALFIAGSAAIVGALLLRLSVLMAGYYDPIWLG